MSFSIISMEFMMPKTCELYVSVNDSAGALLPCGKRATEVDRFGDGTCRYLCHEHYVDLYPNITSD